MVLSILNKTNPIVSSHSGREKCVRFTQYFLMFLIPAIQERLKTSLLQRAVFFQKLVERLGFIKANMGLTRKVMRFGI